MTRSELKAEVTDKRLNYLLGSIGSFQRLIDVGTDHARLPIELAKTASEEEILAVDISKDALTRAKKNIARAGLSEKIKLIHSDGLDQISLRAGDVIVLSGLGGREIIAILTRKLPLPPKVRIILQAQSDLALLREFISEQGWLFLAEKIIEAKGYIYIFIEFSTASAARKLNQLEIELGPLLLSQWQQNRFNKAELNYLEREYRYRLSKKFPSKKDELVRNYLEAALAAPGN